MIYAVLLVISFLFIEFFVLLRMRETALSIVTLSHRAMGVVFSKELSDAQKEVMIRQASFEMLKTTFKFVIKFMSIVLGLYLAYLLLAKILPFSEAAFVESIYSVKVIILVTLVAMTYVWLRNVIIQRLHFH